MSIAIGAAAALAAPADGGGVQVLPAALDVSLERTRLPGGEAMGLVGTSYLLELAPGWWFGPALYGAASGQRGGLFTWGAEAQWHWPLAPRWQLVGGLYVGGGGGAAAPVGGGLMLRPHAEALFDLGSWSIGAGVSRIDFPSGAVGSTQFALLASYHDRFGFAPPDAGTLRFDRAAGLGIARLGIALGGYASRGPQGGRFGTVGMQAEWSLSTAWSAVAQAAGAAKGGAAGYAEFGAGALGLWPPARDSALRWGVQGSVGMAGGGGVASGGGAVARLALVGRLQVLPDWSLDLQAGRVRAFSGDFRTGYLQINAGYDFNARPQVPGARWLLHETAWTLGVEQVLHAQRKTGGAPGLGAVSLEVRRAVGDRLYLSARAVSAIAGGAGAYSSGQLGAGIWLPLDGRRAWRAGIEASAGAAGGGGVASAGGAIVQPMAWLARRFDGRGELRLSAGYLKSLRGDLASPVAGLAWALVFDVP